MDRSVQGYSSGAGKWGTKVDATAYCLHFAYYNFCRIHQTLRVTPAMEAGITARVWNLADLLTV
jgi:hypothetical protein